MACLNRKALAAALPLLLAGSSLLTFGCDEEPTGKSAVEKVRVPIISDPFSKASAKPSGFIFSVNGDLAAEELNWSGWGQESAVGRGRFFVRDYENGGSDITNGVMVVSKLKACGGDLYYTQSTVTFAEGSEPSRDVSLSTPCDR